MLLFRNRHVFLKSYGILAFDLLMAALSLWLAFYLRIGENFLNYSEQFLIRHIGLFTAVSLVVMLFYSLHKYIWRYTSLKEVMTIVKVTTLTVAIYAVVLFFWTRLEGFPRSSLLITWLVMAAFLGGPRILYRAILDRNFRRVLQDTQRQVPILLIGAGDGAEVFIRELGRRRNPPYKVVGIVDDKGSRLGRRIRGHEVICHLNDLESTLSQMKSRRHTFPQRLVITNAGLDGAAVRRLVEVADRFGVNVSRLPELTHFSSTDPRQIQPRPIEIEDLLGRAQARLNIEGVKRLVENRVVLVTGAGGTIGSELCRQIAALGPRRLVLVDSGEFNLYQIHHELNAREKRPSLSGIIADVRNEERMSEIFAAEKPQLVLHAAALKHVPIVENNPMEGIRTNVMGTRVVADLCVRHKVKTMVLISTDKAVNPSSIMGASKRLAESYCQALDAESSTTHFVTVRFGNVLGSTGSVVPLFTQQIAQGGPVTVTHPDMQRYFMSTREAVQLILQAAAHEPTRETRGGIFVLDMGEPVKIVDLARQMIILAGYKPDEDIAITFTGMREGEKLFEELFHEKEELVKTGLEQIYLAQPRHANLKTLQKNFEKLDKLMIKSQPAALDLLRDLVPEYESPAPSLKKAV